VIYCGTGEAIFRADSYAGVGIYKTLKWGDTWKLLLERPTCHIPTRIGRDSIDPFDSEHCDSRRGADESSPRPEDFGGMSFRMTAEVSWRRETFIQPGLLVSRGRVSSNVGS